MRTLLEHQADGIEYTLHTHGLAASVVGGNISARLIQFHVKLASRVPFSRLAALSDRLAAAIGSGRCRVTFDGELLVVEVPRPDPQPVELFSVMRGMREGIPPVSAVLGLDESGWPLLLDLTLPASAHLLISGARGCGKSSLVRSLVTSLALQNPVATLKLLMIEPAKKSYRVFHGLPNLICPVVSDPLDGLHHLKWAARQLEKRLENGVSNPRLVIVIDELDELLAQDRRLATGLIGRVVAEGGPLGIHLVAVSAKLSSTLLAEVARCKFPVRLAGRALSAADAALGSGVSDSGAERLMNYGDFLLYAAGSATRLQAAAVSQAEILRSVDHLGGSAVQAAQAAGQNRTAATGARKPPALQAAIAGPTARLKVTSASPAVAPEPAYRRSPGGEHTALSEYARYEAAIQRRRATKVVAGY